MLHALEQCFFFFRLCFSKKLAPVVSNVIHSSQFSAFSSSLKRLQLRLAQCFLCPVSHFLFCCGAGEIFFSSALISSAG